MFSHLSATLEGLFSIRLYKAQERFDAFNRSLIDADHKALYSIMIVKTLQTLYLDLISCCLVYISAVLVVVLNYINASTCGLVVSNTLQLLFFLPWMVRMGGEAHTAMDSVASVTYFASHIPSEESGSNPSIRPPDDWPSQGGVS
jgi:ABC-type transport system involved in cytochrome bd biosynthesis fused ATPase/permease subunit